MQKFKVYTTIFILYEFVVITILRIPNFCGALFNNNFCNIGNYKYLLFCVMLPTLFGLVVWWMPKKSESQKSTSDILLDIFPPKYIKRFIIAMVIVGIRKFVMSHPRARDFINNVNSVFGVELKNKRNSGKKS